MDNKTMYKQTKIFQNVCYIFGENKLLLFSWLIPSYYISQVWYPMIQMYSKMDKTRMYLGSQGTKFWINFDKSFTKSKF